MSKRVWGFIGVTAFLGVAIFGWNPLSRVGNPSAVLSSGYSSFETGTRRLPNGTYQVSVLTQMPDVRADMVRWWFSDFLRTTEQYQWWHPRDHVWMDWENKRPGEIVGASHLVHERIGGELQRLRIRFIDPAELLGTDPGDEGTFAVCARVGPLDQPIYIATMCHIVRDTEWGAEMRSRFWLGRVAMRDGNEVRPSFASLVANTALARQFAVRPQMATGLMTHATEEMAYLAGLLPNLYGEDGPRTDGSGEEM